MRNAFAKELSEIAKYNDELILLAGDIGNRLFDQFKDQNPNRFYNCGIAEAAMTGVAAGMATAGFHPVTYTITPFNTLRCLEQIKLDICYPNLPVTVVGTGAGLSYASLGATHHSLDDIGVMRAIPNLQILVPGDMHEVSALLRAAINSGKPTYLRLGKKGEPVIHSSSFNYEIGKVIPILDGQDRLIISVGNMLHECHTAINMAKDIYGLNASLVSMGSVYPLDEHFLRKAFKNFERILVVEEHGLLGGAGSAVLEFAHDQQLNINKLKVLHCPKEFLSGTGDQKNSRRLLGLDADNILRQLIV